MPPELRRGFTHGARSFRTVLDTRSAAQTSGEDLTQILFRTAVGEVEIRFSERVDQRPNQMRAADTGAVCRPNVCDQPINKNYLSIHQHNRDLRPTFGVRGSTASPLCDVGLDGLGRIERGRFSC